MAAISNRHVMDVTSMTADSARGKTETENNLKTI